MTEYIPREEVLKHRRKMSGADFGGEFWDEAVLAEIIRDIPAADVIEVGSCDGCYWKGKGRFQKCTYCRRNKNLKDRYLEEGAFDG